MVKSKDKRLSSHKMLVKFEPKSARVKGLSFHPKRPWLLASLHSGIIQLWDYQLNNCLEKFEGHDGPVRGIAFHNEQPIFVSGGDDYRVKVWNYQQRRGVFTLLGHLDYVRATSFHQKHPWILSCSDDQTVRIWNWQSRDALAILTGHNHYVMYAEFHATEPLVVSASLDQTIRVWDISGVVKRYASATPQSFDKSPTHGKLNVDLFGEADFVTKFLLEGHDKGVNWATFHPTLPLILSGADDRQIKLWRMGDEKTWEVDTFRGHYNNVSSAIFHPRQPVVISGSEDKSLRVWDMTRRSSLQIYRRNHDRFWVVAAHPKKNLFCAGHDSGLMLFKLERERPVWVIHQNIMLYVKEKYLRRSNLITGQDISIMRLRTEGRANYAMLSYNPAENSILLSNYDSSYELYGIPEHEDPSLPPDSPRDWKRSSGRNACWLGRNRFAVLFGENQLLIKNTKNEISKKIQVPFNCYSIFAAGTGMVLIQQQPHQLDATEKGVTSVILFDTQLKQVVASVKSVCQIKRAVWSNDKNLVALLGKSSIMLCNKKLEVFTSFVEAGKVKSGAWREAVSDLGAFIYNTSGHLKYALTNGDTGTIRSLDVPIYIVAVKDDMILCFDRECKPQKFKLDTAELLFKTALITGNYNQVVEMIRSCKLVGQSIISYLHRKGYPEIALHFLQKHDERTRFNLALECCNVEVALDCARVLDKVPVWNKLAELAMLLGNHQVAELCYQRTRNISKLAFLYLITGNMEKFKKLGKMSAAQGSSLSFLYWMSLVSGDVDGQIKLLRKSESDGKTLLAYQLALGSNRTETAEEIKSSISPEVMEKFGNQVYGRGDSLQPPEPLLSQPENWPLLKVSKSIFDGKPLVSPLLKQQSHENLILTTTVEGGWADCGGDFTVVDEEGQPKDENETSVIEPSGWDDHEEIVLPSVSSTDLEGFTDDVGYYVVPTKGVSIPEKWQSAYRLPIVHILSGNFESAARLLQEQIGLINIAPYRELFLRAYKRSHVVYTPVPDLPELAMYPVLPTLTLKESISLPQACQILNLDSMVRVQLKGCYELVTKGQFVVAKDAFRNLLLSIPLLVVQNKAEVTKALELISLCKEYILGLQMEMYRKALPKESVADNRRSLELAAYFTHCSLDNVHLMLALRTAMNLSYKLGYFNNAAVFSRRLLELGPSGDLVIQTRKLLKACENKCDSSTAELEYDEHNPFSVCAKSYKPIYRGKPEVKCPFCGTTYVPELAGKLCEVCTVSEIGKSASGIRISQIQFR